MHLHVRPENLKRLKILASLSDAQFDEVLEVLEVKVSTLADGEALRDATSGLKLSSPADVVGIAEAVFPLLFTYVAEGKKPSEVVAAVVAGIREHSTKPDSISGREATVLKGRLSAMLSSRTLGLKAKAAALVVNRGALLVSSKVLTDIRPVFSLQSAAAIDAFTVIHTLVLEVSEDGSEKPIHIALDRSDLDELKKAIERAEIKDKAISKWINTTGVARIDVS